MKLNFKDLKQQKFTVDAEPSDTIADVKQKVAAEKGFDASALRLIWSGKILADGNKLESYEIKPTDQIVCMQQKPKGAPVAKPTPAVPSTPVSQSSSTATPTAPGPAPAASTAVSDTPAAPATPTPAPAQPTSDRSFNDSSALTMGAEREAAFAHMESMGFERADIERAMRAAFFNPDRAVEYLINGIPESAEQNVQQPRAQAPPAAGQAPSTPARPAAPQASETRSSGEGDEPVNLFEAAAAASQGGRGGARGTSGAGTGARAGSGGSAAAAAAAAASLGGGGGGPDAGGNLDFLRENLTFQHLRQLVQQNPQMLENVLQQVTASNPQLAQLISMNPEQFIQLLSEGGGEEGLPMPPGAGAQNITVTEAERDAIERLCRLGFSRDLAIQAYFACDKNEELAANFLFDNPDDDAGGDDDAATGGGGAAQP